MAKGYRITDPVAIGMALSREGWKYRIIPRRSKWRTHLVVQLGELGTEGYTGIASILCGHDGRTSLQIQPGAVRGHCENEFSASPIRIRHTDPDIQTFLDNPDKFLREAIMSAATVASRLEQLKEHTVLAGPRIWADCYLISLLKTRGYKRLAAKYYAIQEGYPTTAWGILQALSNTRSPSLVLAASRALSNQYWEDVLCQRLSSVLREVLPKAKPRKEVAA